MASMNKSIAEANSYKGAQSKQNKADLKGTESMANTPNPNQLNAQARPHKGYKE